jgi:hypothetical protein
MYLRMLQVEVAEHALSAHGVPFDCGIRLGQKVEITGSDIDKPYDV